MALQPSARQIVDVAQWRAFHDCPTAALDALAGLEALDEPGADPALDARARWVRGVALGAAGRYGSALAELLPLAEPLSTAELQPPAEPQLVAGGRMPWAAAAAVAAASLYRQLGLFPAAEQWDLRAAAAAEGRPDCAGVRAEAVLGSAADAVGGGSLPTARDRLAEARTMIGQLPAEAWRERTRLGWVECEVALLGGDPAAARSAAAASAELAAAHAAPRHQGKSLLFEAVAMRVADAGATGGSRTDRSLPAEGDSTALLLAAAEMAEQIGALPLVWVSGRLLSQWLSDPSASSRWYRASGDAVRAIAADLPADLLAVLRLREDAAEFLGPVRE